LTETVTKERLGDRLLQAGVISDNQLKLALKEQKRTHEPLGRILINLGFITENTLARTLADQMGISFISLRSVEFDMELVKSVPPDLARKHLFIPIQKALDGTLTVAMANPANVISVDAIQEFLRTHVAIVAAPESEISSAISMMLERETEWDFDDPHDEGNEWDAAALSPTGEWGSPSEGVDKAIEQALRNQATDIHIEPEKNLLRIRYRIDGVLHTGETLSKDMISPILTRVKIMAGLDITERRLPQDGRISVDYNQRKIDLRVSTMPTKHGENIVIRILDRGSVSLDLEELGVHPGMRKDLDVIANRPCGMLLVSGPTGSGKTTTLYSLLLSIDSLSRKIVTIEDPIEYELPLIRQSQVDPNNNYSFAEGLRTILRQDPDVILLGEIRDRETADVGMRAALTGHVVFSSIHTNTALGTIPRLMDIGIDPFLITSSLAGAIAQRLVRKVCMECREAYEPTDEEVEWLGFKGGSLALYKARGCPLCRHTGYVKRTGIFELFKMDGDFAHLISNRSSERQLEEMAREKGMTFMVDDGKRKVIDGITTTREVLRVCQNL
jgi:type IV pilus assembly protein PilB